MIARICLLLLVPSVVAVSLGAAHAAREPIARLGPGDAAFWDGVPLAEGDTKIYDLEVARGGALLRVAIDVPDRTDEFVFSVRAPGTQPVNAATSYSFNAEAFVEDPAAGRWTISVRSNMPEATPFRMRAKLEGPAREAKRVVQLRPNLRAVPPYQFTFIAPVTGPNVLFGDYDNRGLEVGGQHPMSCSLDETAEYQDARCLRFTAGIQNAGDGPLDLRFTPIGDAVDTKMTQLVYLSDGKTSAREAGTFEFHPTHYHYHYTDIWSFKLLRVEDAHKPVLRDVGRGHKSGFCPGDQAFAEWHRFNQDPIYTHWSNCGMDELTFFTPSSGEGRMAMSTGWGDIYRWYRPGNYVEFTGLEDGRYVLQEFLDIHEWVLETNERDNVGYAYVEIEGDEVKLLERGYGVSPWDQNKSVVVDWWKGLAKD